MFLASENNSNILAPILGQYGIKPSDFLVKLKEVFLHTFKGKIEHIDIDMLLNVLIFSFVLSIGKNNTYMMGLRKFNFSFLYNIFAQHNKEIYLDMLFIFKLYILGGNQIANNNKNKCLFFLIKRLLKLRVFVNLFFFKFIIIIWWVIYCFKYSQST